VGVAFAVGAARTAPLRLGFSLGAGMMIAVGLGCVIAALRGRVD
jgi:hypothetical protein